MTRRILVAALLAAVASAANSSEVDDRIRDLLAAKETADRTSAYTALMAIVDEDAVPALLAATREIDTDTITGYYLVYCIQRAGGPRARAALLQVTDHANSQVAGRAAWALTSMGERTWVKPFLERIADESTDHQRRVDLVNTFASMRDLEVLDQLAGLYDRVADDEIRAAIVRSLAYSQEERYIPVYRKALESGDERTRSAALQQLVASGDPAAIAAIESSLDQMPLADLNQLISALARIDPFTADQVRLLLIVLELEDLQVSTASSLFPLVGRAGDRAALPRLHDLLASKNETIAAGALGAIVALEEEEDLRRTLAGIATREEPKLRLVAAKALLELGDPGAVEQLAVFLNHQDAQIRREVAEAFEHHAARAAIPHLIEALADEDASVRASVDRSLQSNLRAFFPYRTPDLAQLGILGVTEIAGRRAGIERLRSWWARKNSPR